MRLWLAAAFSFLFICAVACGGSGGGSGFGSGSGPGDSGFTSEDSGPVVILGTTDGGGTTNGTCKPKTCADLGANCGPQGDGCGGIIDGGCGGCDGGQSCGGGGAGTGSTCGGQTCVPQSCAQQGIGCGPAGDLCGNLLNCYPDDASACPPGQTCGGGGTFQCGADTILDAGLPDAASCLAHTCQLGQCGPTQNGCGGALSCGACGAGGVCGYPTPFFCGYPPDGGSDGGLCVPKTCTQQGIGCGFAGDGCGNVINCWPTTGAGADGGSCPNNGVCGLTDAGQCAVPPSTGADGGAACVPSKTCAALNCGYIDDGCGNILDCWPDGGSPDSGAACSGFNNCGGGGLSNVCGGSPAPADGGSLCVPLTCAQQGISCGAAGDGCGHVLNCFADGGTSCGTSAVCEELDGGPVQCVPTTTICVPTTCAAQHLACGQAGDGCGGLLDCYPNDAGACADAGSCITVDGGAVECVPPTTICQPTTCANLGYNCGYTGDGCGGLLDCNTSDAGCASPEYCGGGGSDVCGFGYTTTDGGTYVSCAGSSVTSISGIAYAATDPTTFDVTVEPDPLSGAYVWVPSNGVLPPITPGVTCTQCADPASALAVAITNADGSFNLPNVPVQTGQTTVPLIVQVGRWARLITVNVTPCQPNTVTQYALRLPRNSTEGNMPWLAFDTGYIDSLECVLLKMGIQSTMFASPATVVSDMTSGTAGAPKAGGTRVAIYTSPDTEFVPGTGTVDIGGAIAPDGTTTTGANLYGSSSTMDEYDAVLFPCVGSEVTSDKSTADIQNVVGYANAGGRIFATHYSYVWAFDDYADAPSVATEPAYAWGCTSVHSGQGTNGETYNLCDTTGDTVGAWDPQQAIANDITANVDTSTANGRAFGQWMVDLGAATLASGAVDGGVGAGTVVTFGIDNARWDLNSLKSTAQQWAYYNGGTNAFSVQQMTFNTPVNGAASAQCGRVVFSDFHVNNNTTPLVEFPKECTSDGGATVTGHLPALTSQERALEYMIFNLTSCVSPTSPVDSCQPKTCASYPVGTCGDQSDGCGSFVTCPGCTGSETCGGGGVAGQCGTSCTKRTCSYYGANACGTQSDGCGGELPCDTCTPPATCGGGGVANQCGACVPKTCAEYVGMCGQQSDGCGGLTLYCNPCTLPATCGGSGVADVCGIPDASVCMPLTCANYPPGTCGEQPDGCGSLVGGCTPCTLPQTCGGGGVASQCGSPDAGECVRATCAAFPGVCGEQADGCGGLTAYCNPCPGTQTCGGGGTVGVCGSGACVPVSCMTQGITCGPAGDGCGGGLTCGTCAAGQTCGGGGVAGVCGGCTPITCTTPGVGCGTNGDGCGGSITCTCPAGETCGGGGVAGACGTSSCVPETCAGLNLSCGYEADGCGNLLDCGSCSGGASCVNGACVGGGTPQVRAR